jgi:hypothetical protein
VPAGAEREGRLSKADFRIDLAAGTVTCPAGQTAIIDAPHRSGTRAACFPRRACAACPLRDRCVSAGGDRQIMILAREDLLQAGRAALSDPTTREHLRRTRPRIERPLALLVSRYHARKARYFGRRKALLQAAWTAVLVNLHPIVGALRAQAA